MEELFMNFVQDPRTRLILLFIFLDLITGVSAALRTGFWRLREIAQFHRTMVAPFVVGYAAWYSVTTIGLADTLPIEIAEGISSIGWLPVIASLSSSIKGNIDTIKNPVKPKSYDRTYFHTA